MAVGRTALVAVGLLLGIGLLEWALYAFNIERLPFTNPDLYQLDPAVGYAMKPSVRVYSHGAWFETNKHGFRGPDWEEACAPQRRCVMFLGDSVTVGFGVDFEESLAGRFTALNRQGMIGISLAVSGLNAQQEFVLADRHAGSILPRAIVLVFVSNDFEAPYPIFEWRIDPPDERGWLVPVKRWLRRHSVLYAFSRKRLRSLLGTPSDPVAEWEDPDLSGESPESRARFQKFEEGFTDMVRNSSAPVLLCAFSPGIPPRGRRLLEEIASRSGAAWVDLGVLWKDKEDYLENSALGWDSHPNASALDRMARLITAAVEKTLAGQDSNSLPRSAGE